MSYGPGKALGGVMSSVTKGVFPWDEADWKSAGQMSEYAMQGMAAGAAVIIVLIIIAVSFVVSVFVKRAVGKHTTVARILWWTFGIFVACGVLLTLLLLYAPAYQALGWYLVGWSFCALCVIATGCEIYSMRSENGEIQADDVENYLTSFTPSPSPSPNGKKTLVRV